jgi:hypothetical protein
VESDLDTYTYTESNAYATADTSTDIVAHIDSINKTITVTYIGALASAIGGSDLHANQCSYFSAD